VTAAIASFAAWRDKVTAGSRFEYFTGHIGEASARDINVYQLKGEVVKAYLSGDFELAQTRLDSRRFSYFIIKRRVRDASIRLWIRGGANDHHKPRLQYRRAA
jgi:hypothetical protein